MQLEDIQGNEGESLIFNKAMLLMYELAIKVDITTLNTEQLLLLKSDLMALNDYLDHDESGIKRSVYQKLLDVEWRLLCQV